MGCVVCDWDVYGDYWGWGGGFGLVFGFEGVLSRGEEREGRGWGGVEWGGVGGVRRVE